MHPYFEFSAYNDIAIIELGKRIEYDMDTRGQEPTCLGRAEKVMDTDITFKIMVNMFQCFETQKIPISVNFYRVTIQVVTNLPVDSKIKVAL